MATRRWDHVVRGRRAYRFRGAIHFGRNQAHERSIADSWARPRIIGHPGTAGEVGQASRGAQLAKFPGVDHFCVPDTEGLTCRSSGP